VRVLGEYSSREHSPGDHSPGEYSPHPKGEFWGEYSSREHSSGEYSPHPKGEGSLGGVLVEGVFVGGVLPTSKR